MPKLGGAAEKFKTVGPRVSGESCKENAKINFEGDASEEHRCLLKVCF